MSKSAVLFFMLFFFFLMGMGSVTFDFGNQELLGRSRINMNQRGAGTLVARTDFFLCFTVSHCSSFKWPGGSH